MTEDPRPAPVPVWSPARPCAECGLQTDAWRTYCGQRCKQRAKDRRRYPVRKAARQAAAAARREREQRP